ncbi:MAG: lysozyme [Lachnospiraceae bacterium]|nr:lysozyme [Lachnospiraceae bacterium]
MSPLAVFFILLALAILVAGGWFIYTHFIAPKEGFVPEDFTKNEAGRMVYTGNDPDVNARFGIDVSEFQLLIDWERVKADGVTFVYVRAGYRGYGTGKLKEDGLVRQNVTGARAVGLDVGVYFYSQAISEAEAEEEAEFLLKTIEGLDLTLPPAIDIEKSEASDARTKDLTGEDWTIIAVAFSERMLREGITPMVYGNREAFEKKLDRKFFPKARIWYANYSSLKKRTVFDIWQYDQHGHVDGIEPEVDFDIMMTDLSIRK